MTLIKLQYLIVTLVLLFLLVGCARVGEEAAFLKGGMSENVTEELPAEEVSGEPAPAVEPASEVEEEPVGEEIAEPVLASEPASEVEEESAEEPVETVTEEVIGDEIVEERVEEIDEESFEAKTSGSLNLQSKLDLCPHLKHKFDCDKYSLKLCNLDNLGFAQFVPQQIVCKTSSISGNEVCLLKECRPIADKGGIVKGYGGIFARGEYSFVKTSVDNKVWHDYSLERCGEMKKEFETEQDCISWYD